MICGINRLLLIFQCKGRCHEKWKGVSERLPGVLKNRKNAYQRREKFGGRQYYVDPLQIPRRWAQPTIFRKLIPHLVGHYKFGFCIT